MKGRRFLRVLGISLLALMIGFISGLTISTEVKAETNSPEVILDGERLRFDVPPSIINESTMVPMRKIFESLGANIAWDNQTKTVTAYQNGLELVYTIGQSTASINGREISLTSTPGQIMEGRTLVPLRFVSESFGAYVGYEGSTRTVVIRQNHTPGSGHPSPLNQYRMTLPYHTILQDAPALIAYMNEHSRFDSYVFFGDSLTWGSYLGRAEVHPYLIQMKTGKSTFNFGVPGFSDDQLLDFIPYALQQNDNVNVVIQLQYFWDEESSYSGFDELLGTPELDYAAALERIKLDLQHDEAYVDPPQVPYQERDDAYQQERIARAKELFPQGSRLPADYRDRLTRLAEWMSGRPQQTFYVYIPPYFMEMINRFAPMTSEDYALKIEQIRNIFTEIPNVYFKDFNELENTWQAEHFIDLWHKTREGEKELAHQFIQWFETLRI